MDYPFQSNRLAFHHYGFEDGLNTLPIEHMLEDHQGYMWFGSSSGLCRFNGYQFQNAGEELLPGQDLPDLRITCLMEDQSNQLWVGTPSGIAILDPWRESVRYLQAGQESENSLSNNYVHCMAEEQEGMIWIGTEDGLNRYDPNTNQMETIKFDQENPNSIPFPILGIEIDDDNKLWLVFGERVICRFDPILNESIFFYSSRFTHDWIYDIRSDPDLERLHPLAKRVHYPFVCDLSSILKTQNGNLWAMGWGYNLVEIDPSTLHFTLHPVSRRFNYKSLMMENACMIEDQNGHFWFGRNPYGIYRLNPDTNEIAFEVHSPLLSSTLAENAIRKIYEDRSGNIWVSTNSGLELIKRIESRYRKTLISASDQYEGYTISIDHEDQIWLGTNKGIVKYDRQNSNKFILDDETEFLSDSALNLENIHSLEADPSGKLWVGTYPSGLGYFDLKEETFHRIPKDPSTYAWRMLNVTFVCDIKLSDQMLWFGTIFSGLGSIDLRTNKVQWYYSDELRRVNFISPFENDTAFVASENRGLFYVNASTQEIHQFPYTDSYADWDQTKLFGFDVYSLHQGVENDLWIATNLGLNRYDLSTKTFRVWRQQDGLQEPRINLLNAFSGDHLFLAYHLSGVAKVNIKDLVANKTAFRTLSQSNIQFKTKEVNNSIVTKDGSLIYMGEKTIVEIEPDYQSPYVKSSSSTIQIQSILVNDHPISLDRFHQPETAHLPYGQNQFTFQYVVLDYMDTSKNVSRYRLVQNGISDEWSNAGGMHQVQYRDLGAGTYRFEIEGRHPSGEWGIHFINFVITPPYWQTWWFYTLSLIVFIGLAYGVFVYRVRHIRAQNRMLEQKVHKRTTQLRTEMEYSKKILDSSPSIIFGFSTDGSLTYINPSGESMLGYLKENMVGEKWWNLIAFHDDQDQLQQIHKELQDYDFFDQEMDLTIQTGKTHHIVWNFVNHFNEKGNLQETLAFGLDMTDQIEREIAKTSAKEQRRIGQEIHDSVCQTLTGVTLMCESLEKKREKMQEEDASVISQVLNHVQKANDQSRQIAHGLYLHELEADGLETALMALTENIETLFNIPCRYSSNKTFIMDDVDVSTQIYRITQEAMSNAAKYSQSSSIELLVDVRDENIVFSVSDNGVGFKVSESANKGMGLNIMRHRAKLINASIEIQSQLNKGTKVNCILSNTL